MAVVEEKESLPLITVSHGRKLGSRSGYGQTYRALPHLAFPLPETHLHELRTPKYLLQMRWDSYNQFY